MLLRPRVMRQPVRNLAFSVRARRLMNYKKILGMLALLWPIVKEIRKYRAEHAEKYGHDLDRICETLRTQQAKSERKVVTLGPRLLLSQQCTRQSRDNLVAC